MTQAVASEAPVRAPLELRADAARNRARVLEVAREQIDAGDLSLPMNTIARQAGVGVGTVYRHFPTRQALLEEVASDGFEELLAEARQAAVDVDPAKGLERLLRRAGQLLSDDPAFAAVLATPTCVCEATMQRGAELGSSIATVLERARRSGLVRRDVTPDDLRRLVSGLEHALHAGPRDETKLDVYLEVLLAGLRSPGPRRARSSKQRATTK
jgi:AcrR family transcriptional regulator